MIYDLHEDTANDDGNDNTGNKAAVIKDVVDCTLLQVDGRSSGKTCLQVACHQGHMDIVRLLLHHKASLDIADDDGDLALHYAAFG